MIAEDESDVGGAAADDPVEAAEGSKSEKLGSTLDEGRTEVVVASDIPTDGSVGSAWLDELADPDVAL